MDDEVNLENLDSLPDVVSDEDAANGDIPAAQQQVASEADAQPAADEVRVLVEFIRTSRRGGSS